MINTDFLKRLEQDNKWYRQGYITEVCTPYVKATEKVIVDTIYGKCKITPSKLINRGCKPNIQSSINPQEFLWNMLVDNNKYFGSGLIIRLGQYTNMNTLLEVHTKYGICLIKPTQLMNGAKPTIQSAINKNEYFINQCKEKFGSKSFTYDKVEYIGSTTSVTINCQIHGEFEKTPQAMLRLTQKQGCPICSRVLHNITWLKHAKLKYNMNKEHTFTLYVVKCFDDKETFIKVGITSRDLKIRLNTIPYKCEVVKLIESSNYKHIWKLECQLKLWIHKNDLYKPERDFGGYFECCGIESLGKVLKLMNHKTLL